MDDETQEALDNFDEAFEEALSELLASGVTEDDVREFFGPTGLGQYILERMRINENILP